MDKALAYAHSSADQCYRCGCDLHGIADDQACPECGLLAVRSRRVTDELHETRPKWLRALAIGILFILGSVFISLIWWAIGETVIRAFGDSWLFAGVVVQATISDSGFIVAAFALLIGVMFLTRAERYKSADRKDRWFRWILRAAALAPLIAVIPELIGLARGVFETRDELSVPFHVYLDSFAVQAERLLAIPLLLMLGGCAMAVLALPLLIFLRLRGLAKRARSAHLAEHCMIVGVGTTLALLWIAGVWAVCNHIESSVDANWSDHSNVALGLILAVYVAGWLFILWSLYLMIRFAIAFLSAAKVASQKWVRDDRSRSGALA
jgi:hypothetical protein